MSDMIDGRGNAPRALPEFDLSDVVVEVQEEDPYDLFEYTAEAIGAIGAAS